MQTNRSLAVLNLDINGVLDAGAASFARALGGLRPRCALRALHLTGNSITARGAQALVDALEHNTSVESPGACGLRLSS